MEIKDMVGMMSTGALIAIGVMYLGGQLGGPDEVPVAMVQQEPRVDDAVDAQSETVTRTDINLLGQSTAQQLQRIVALSADGLSQTPELTPEQQEIVTFFERAAREMNQTTDRSDESAFVQFSNMAVQGLRVRYFYRVGQTFDAVNRNALLTEQQAVMKQTLCGNDAVRTLLTDYGFEYTYTYVSADSRYVGALEADKAACT